MSERSPYHQICQRNPTVTTILNPDPPGTGRLYIDNLEPTVVGHSNIVSSQIAPAEWCIILLTNQEITSPIVC